MNPVLSFAIILIGVYGVVFSRNIIKSIICFAITETSLILLFLNLSYVEGSGIPIVSSAKAPMVDPLPQALMITAIVIGASVTALALMISIKIFHHFGTLEWKRLFMEK
ncbi:MAG TPA: cation:proton antiporter subunit C [Clostridia bacterium]|nr:cation:proton antiporter subunit C [Clostridia bacterium]